MVIGGEMLAELRRLAGPTTEALGSQPFAQLPHQYARARRLIFPGEADFGTVPVEAMVSGCPVVAFGRGGATEALVCRRAGMFFNEQTEEALIDAVSRLKRLGLNSADIALHARQLNPARFERQRGEAVSRPGCRSSASRSPLWPGGRRGRCGAPESPEADLRRDDPAR